MSESLLNKAIGLLGIYYLIFSSSSLNHLQRYMGFLMESHVVFNQIYDVRNFNHFSVFQAHLICAILFTHKIQQWLRKLKRATRPFVVISSSSMVVSFFEFVEFRYFLNRCCLVPNQNYNLFYKIIRNCKF